METQTLIKNDEQNYKVLKKLETLLDKVDNGVKLTNEEADRVELLAQLIENYKEKNIQ